MRLYEKPTWRDARIILPFIAFLASWVAACICLRGPIGGALFLALLLAGNIALGVFVALSVWRMAKGKR